MGGHVFVLINVLRPYGSSCGDCEFAELSV
jgi:hypothetical protein